MFFIMFATIKIQPWQSIQNDYIKHIDCSEDILLPRLNDEPKATTAAMYLEKVALKECFLRYH